MFWILVVILLLVVMAILLPCLIRPRINNENSDSAEIGSIYRQQLDELEQDKSNQILGELKYESAKNELARRYLDELNANKPAPVLQMPDKKMAFFLITVIPVFALFLYFKLGSPSSIDRMSETKDFTHQALPTDHSSSLNDLETLLTSLELKLKDNPSDGNGWALLARSYVELKQHSRSIVPFKNATKYISDDSQLLADYADALAVVNGNNLNGQPEQLIKQALKLDSNNVKAQLLAATLAFNKKDYALAIAYWKNLQKSLPAGSEVLPEINASLREAMDVYQLKMPTPNQVSNIVHEVSGIVRVSPELINKIEPSYTLYIFAKSTQGKAMPLAIIRTKADKLPYQYRLDDNNAIDSNYKLSDVDEVEIVARISKSGDAKPAKGDLIGKSRVLLHGTKLQDVYIDSVID